MARTEVQIVNDMLDKLLALSPAKLKAAIKTAREYSGDEGQIGQPPGTRLLRRLESVLR